MEEERLSRVKHTRDFPVLAARFCLEREGLRASDLDHVAFCFNPWHAAPRIAAHFLRNLPHSLWLLRERATGGFGNMFHMRRIARDRLREDGAALRFGFHFVEHHLAHAASVFFVSPFEEAAILSLDGVGEWATTLSATGHGNRITKVGEVGFPHSLGLLYQAVTVHLGFRKLCDETKVMGLASYGDPARYRDLFRKVLRLVPDGSIVLDRDYVCFDRHGHRRMLSDSFVAAAGAARVYGEPVERRHEDLAAALQERTGEAGVHIAAHLRRRTGLSKLCLAGGVALNSVMNERIRTEAGFDEVFMQPACNDAGTASGAALWLQHSVLGHPRRFVFCNPYTGPEYDEEQMAAAIRAAGLDFESPEPARLIEIVAEALDRGEVVGWFQGRSEWGPRALGNRSILADPRRADMRDVLNAKVKHRESFRPFAPVVPLERAREFFACSQPSPYMLFVTAVREEKRSVIPAVTHVDGTARIQTVTAEVNPRLYQLLLAFERRTGVPVLLNTSFNNCGEPIVCSPTDAVNTFERTRIDLLAMGPFLARKQAQP